MLENKIAAEWWHHHVGLVVSKAEIKNSSTVSFFQIRVGKFIGEEEWGMGMRSGNSSWVRGLPDGSPMLRLTIEHVHYGPRPWTKGVLYPGFLVHGEALNVF